MTKMPLPSGITLTASGKFHVDKQHNGKRYVQTCDSLALAELFIAQVKAGVITVSSTAEDSATPMTMREVMNRYVDYRVDTSKSDSARPRQYNSYANALIAHFGADTFLDAITMPMQKALFDDMLSKYSASHINGTSSFLHGAMTYAYERGGMTNKPQRMGHVKVAEGRKRYLSDVEDQCAENWFYDNAPDFVALYHFYMDTGCRKSEAFQLEWADIDFQSNRITFWGNRTKTGKSRSVSMTGRIKAALRQLRLERGATQAKVFGHLSLRSFENAWGKMRHALGLSDDKQFVIHAMRHTCCTRLLANGVDIITAQAWMGHSDIRQTAAYAHVMPRNLDAAAKALENHGQDASQAREVI